LGEMRLEIREWRLEIDVTADDTDKPFIEKDP
jgi:hypothetical protein